MKTSEKIESLRSLMKQHGLAAWIVPSADPHQSEYVADCWKNREWLSGFTGSAGTVVVTEDKAGLWTDARYFERAEKQLDGSGITLFKQGMPDVPDYVVWLLEELPQNSAVGFDGNVVSFSASKHLEKKLNPKGIRLFFEKDLLAELWSDRPSLPDQPVTDFPVQYAGETRHAKLSRVREKLRMMNGNYYLLSKLDEIAWTINIRGGDVNFNPVTVSYLLIGETEAVWFVQMEKVSPVLAQMLEADHIFLKSYKTVQEYLTNLPREAVVVVDPSSTSVKLYTHLLNRCLVISRPSIANRFKSVKNDVELAGSKAANLRDCVAFARWMMWLEDQGDLTQHTEITLAEKLTNFRQMSDSFKSLSFSTIVGYQANSAEGHYSPQPETTPNIQSRGILLVDSGGQYLDGTTDITRTFTLSEPTPEQRKVYTTVLKSLIRLTTARFPVGTRGFQLDALAREPLWKEGWECRHGIGHGVGHYLNVHEGPAGLARLNQEPLLPGMLMTIEPGVYFIGQFGVRLENMVIITEFRKTDFGKFFGFETITFLSV